MCVSDGVTILRGIVGSTAYGLAHEGSDIDWLGLFVAPTVKFHGLHPPIGKAASRVQNTPSDYTEHEASKYVSLLLSCNPTVTELLWLPEGLYEIVHPEGLALIALRQRFLGAVNVRNAYLGYATQQFRKLVDRDGTFSSDTAKRTEKHARHLKRLCWQGLTLYREGWLPIKVDDPEEYHEFGRLVAEDPNHAADMIARYEDAFNTTSSVLPERPDEAPAEEWLLDVRARHYDGPVYMHGKVHYSPPPDERASNYLSNLVAKGLVGYHSISECEHAIANLTGVFERVDAGRASET